MPVSFAGDLIFCPSRPHLGAGFLNLCGNALVLVVDHRQRVFSEYSSPDGIYKAGFRLGDLRSLGRNISCMANGVPLASDSRRALRACRLNSLALAPRSSVAKFYIAQLHQHLTFNEIAFLDQKILNNTAFEGLDDLGIHGATSALSRAQFHQPG